MALSPLRFRLLGLLLLAACGDAPDQLSTGSENAQGDPDDADADTIFHAPGIDAGRTELPPSNTHVGGNGEFPDEPVDEDAQTPDADAQAPDEGHDASAPPGLDGSTLPVDASDRVDAAPSDGAIMPDGCAVRAAARDVDLLFVIDNSGSMAQEQARLIGKLSQLVAALTAGDREAGKPSPSTADYPGRRFTPPASLHIGVVTSNMGAPPGVQVPASPACAPGNGNNGALQTSGAIAALDQVDANTQVVVRAGVPACASVALAPGYLAFGAGAGNVDPANATAVQEALFRFSCVATVGLNGCGIEQPLESMWKALAPASDPSFVGPDTMGQGDRANLGFLRPQSVLAAVVVTDEDDCSVTSAGTLMFERTGPAGTPSVNTRCQLLAGDPAYASAYQPISRYAQGLLSLRASLPERVVFAGIVGLPTAGVDLNDHAALLANPQMQARLEPSDPTLNLLAGVCGSDAVDGLAYPGRRYVELARSVSANGGSAVLESICRSDYGSVLDAVVAKIGTQLTNGCTSDAGT